MSVVLAMASTGCTGTTTIVDEAPYVEFSGAKYFAGNPSGLSIEDRDLQPVGQPGYVSFGGVDTRAVYGLAGVDPNAVLVMKATGAPWPSPYVLLFREGVSVRPTGGYSSSNALVVPSSLRGLCQYAAPSPGPGEPRLEGC